MAIWLLNLLFDLLLPLIMIGFGKSFMKEPPGEINSAYGYRTRRSTKNWDTWTFAHRYFGSLWYRCGRIMLRLTVVVLFFVMGQEDDLVRTVGSTILFIQLFPCIGTTIPTELALRKTFDENGIRRQAVGHGSL